MFPVHRERSLESSIFDPGPVFPMRMALPSPTSLVRLTVAVALGLATGGCWISDAIVTGGVAASGTGPSLEKKPVLLVATTRRATAERPWFGAQRGRGLAFAEARLTAPDRSLTGRVASIVSGDWSLAAVEKVRSDGAANAFVDAALGRDVLLYVHGYRESFETAAVSTAQLSSGIGFRGASALFSWPSGGATFDYVHDRESALWSRDAFEDLLKALADSPSDGRVHIIAHSMGTMLTLETLRMLRGAGGETAMARIGAVVLAAPDIDLDLFTRGIERLGPDAKKITVISSTNDRALGIASRLAGGVRAGGAEREKLERLEALGVRIADASDYGGGGLGILNHDIFLANAEVQQVVKRAIEREGG
jgi:esterase/lipase superfamily enzyme